jgi:hypothetical protein
MTSVAQNTLANRYLVDDVPGAVQTGARLYNILVAIAGGGPLSRLSQDFLVTHGFKALHALANGSIERPQFERLARIEREQRAELARTRAADIAATLAIQTAERNAALKAHFAAIASDPKLRRQREAKELRARFGIGYVEPEHYSRVMSLLRRMSSGQRLQPDDIVWLKTEADDCWTDELRKEWHALEAKALAAAWQKTGDPWDAVNGSSHYRKAGQSELALSLTESALAKGGVPPKILSALETTRGGAYRDLRRLAEAKTLGLNAHHLTPTDFRPCTLLGAVHIEQGDLATGHGWYVKAEKLGADTRDVDHDLRALIARATKSEQHRICAYLIAQDAHRFSWLRLKLREVS